MERDGRTSGAGPPPPDGRRLLGRYQLGEVLGRGGMATVYRASDPSGAQVAVKIAHATLDSELLERRFEREAAIRLDHPNITRVHDAGVDDRPYIVLELLEGESLQARLRAGPLSPEQVRDLGLQACRGLAAAHAAGIVHRDLKPANLFCCTDGTVKLLDFGVALWEDDRTRMTAAGTILGTPAYIAPEQARGESDIDARTDLWALGAVLYEALSGRVPFSKGPPLATLLAVVMDEPAPLSLAAPDAPADLVTAIEGALVKNRDRRYSTADAFREALESVSARGMSARTLSPSPPSSSIEPGERRVVAIMLADGVNNPYVIRNAVQERGGVFIRLLGARAIGLFGGKAWEGDEMVRAASAALATRFAADRMAVTAGRATGAGGSISGDVVSAAEEACRAPVEGVVVEAGSSRSLAEHFSLRAIDERWRELVVAASARSQSGGERREVELVGRRAEIAQLESAVRTVVDEGEALVVQVTGPPGIGKSRLRRELGRMVEESVEGAAVVVAQATPLSREASLSLFAAALEWVGRRRHLARGGPRLDQAAPVLERRAALEALAAEALDDPRRARECAAFLAVLVGAAPEKSPILAPAQGDPQLMRDRIRLALLDYFTGLAGKGPLALLFDDLQWADEATVQLLGDLLDRLADAPLLVFVGARPELDSARPELLAGRDVIRMEPRRLGSAEVGRLAAAIAGRELRDVVLRAVIDRTAGNPLFVEQIVLALRDEGRLDDDVDTLPLPTTVEAVVQSRLDHLLREEKELCKRAAVLGRPFTEEEVRALGAGDADIVLPSLRRRKLLGSRAAPGAGARYFFRSSLMSDVAYRMLADDRRQKLHRLAAAHLALRPEADVEEVAGHFERGGDAASAASWYARATAEAAGRGDTGTVLRCSQRALELGAPREQRFALFMARSDALGFLGRRDEQAAALECALAAATSAAERARALTWKGFLLSRTGRSEEALAVAEAAEAEARESADDEVFALARGWQAVALAWGGRILEARAALAEAMATAAPLGVHVRALAQEWRAQVAGLSGDLGERRAAFGTLVELHREAGDIRRAAGAETNLADVENRFGSYAAAESALRAAIEGCRRVGNHIMEGFALANLGYSLAMLGRTDEALSAIDEAAALSRSMGEEPLAAACRVYRSRARLLAGTELATVAREAEQIAKDCRVALPGLSLLALVVAARARLGSGDAESALALSTRAMALRDELGGVEEDEAEVFLAHAQALDACGHAAEAAEVRRRGLLRVEEIAAGIDDPDLRRRFFANVPAHQGLGG